MTESIRPPNTQRVVLLATSTGWVYRSLQVIGGLITLPLIVANLGKDDYAIWVLVGQTISFLALSDLGVNNAVSRYVARYRGQNDVESVSRFLSTVFALMLAFGVMVALLTLALAPVLAGFLGIRDAAQAQTTQLVFVIAGLALACQFPLRIGMGVLTGYQLYGPHGVGKILESVISSICVVALAMFNYLNVLSLALSSAIIAIATQTILLILAWRLTRPWSLRVSKVNAPMAKGTLSFGSSALLITVSGLAYTQGMGIAVGRLAGMDAVAIYGVVMALMLNIQPLISAVAGATPTLASEWDARNDLARLRRIIDLTMRVTFAMAASVAAGVFVYGEPALQLLLHRAADWTAQDYHVAWLALLVMSVGMAIGMPQLVARSALQSTGRHWAVTHSVLVSSLIGLGVGVLSMMAGWGVVGAAIGWSTVLVVQGVFLFPPMVCRFLRQSPREMLLKAYLPGIWVGLFVLVLALLLSARLIPNNAVNVILGMGLTAGFGCLAIVLMSGQANLVWARLGLRRG